MKPNAHLVNGLKLADQKDWVAAERAFHEHLQVDPQSVQAWFCLGSVRYEQRKYADAEFAFRKATRLAPDFPEAFNNLGNSILQQDRLEEAQQYLEQAVLLQPDFKEAVRNLGGALSLIGRYEEAKIRFERALEIDPQDPEAHAFLGLVLLVLGDFERGWQEYAWRLKTPAMIEGTHKNSKIWDGSSLDGKTLLLLTEQGLGDTIQFVRYAERIKQKYNCKIVCAVQAGLIPLLKSVEGIDELLPVSTSQVPEHDFCLPLLDLPRIFNDTPATFPAKVPYLSVAQEEIDKWAKRLEAYKGFRIGLSWQGSKAMARDSIRSAPLETLISLSKLEGIHLFSLQKGEGTEQIEALGGRMNVIPLGSQLDKKGTGSFMDTAAVIKNLDLVISVDTAVAHVAGALGVPTWLALHVAPDWRWLLKRDDTVWYPQTRLFRQTRLRDWHGVFERMAVELTRMSPKIRVKSPESYRIASTGMNRLNAAKHGLMLYNRHDAYIGRSLETYGEFSDDELTVFRQIVRPGSIVVEAGANIGTHTVELSRIVGDQGRVYAFEPQRIVFQTLCANVQLNSRNNVICRQEAVGEADGIILVPPIDYRSANNFGGLALGSYREGEPVPVVRIDDLKLPHCGLIKCDVEGMEVSVLKGAKETIEKYRPVLYVENDRRERSPALIEFLMSLDYDCYWDLPTMYRRGNFYANPENVFSQIRSINMLCVPKKANANIEGMRRVTGPNDWWQTA